MKIFKIIALAVILSAFFVSNKAFADLPLSQKEVADLAKPSVVKIIQKVKGEASVPRIEVDFVNLAVKTKPNTEPQKIQIDENLMGTGVVVNQDGYIMTNSHVVSYQTIKNLIAADFIYSAIEDAYAALGEEQAKKLQENRSEEDLDKFGGQIADYFLSQSQFNVEKNIIVLNPSSQKEKLDDLIVDGFTATLVSVNDDFYKNSRDAALIKIGQGNLPALSLGASKDASTGKKVYIFGYPSTAELSEKDVLEPTFTEGSISAARNSIKKDFKIFQTNAKISKGSSGGPLLDENGAVIGLVTFITSDLTKQDGDSFAFAIPIDVAREAIKDHALPGQTAPEFSVGDYEKSFRAGLELLRENQCKKAIENFNLALKTNENFPVNKFVEPYKARCEGIIGSGKSLDSILDKLKEKIHSIGWWVWLLIVGGVVLIGALAFVGFWLFRRVKKDEKELDNVEKYLNLNLVNGEPVEENREIEE